MDAFERDGVDVAVEEHEERMQERVRVLEARVVVLEEANQVLSLSQG